MYFCNENNSCILTHIKNNMKSMTKIVNFINLLALFCMFAVNCSSIDSLDTNGDNDDNKEEQSGLFQKNTFTESDHAFEGDPKVIRL